MLEAYCDELFGHLIAEIPYELVAEYQLLMLKNEATSFVILNFFRTILLQRVRKRSKKDDVGRDLWACVKESVDSIDARDTKIVGHMNLFRNKKKKKLKKNMILLKMIPTKREYEDSSHFEYKDVETSN